MPDKGVQGRILRRAFLTVVMSFEPIKEELLYILKRLGWSTAARPKVGPPIDDKAAIGGLVQHPHLALYRITGWRRPSKYSFTSIVMPAHKGGYKGNSVSYRPVGVKLIVQNPCEGAFAKS